MEAVTEDEVWVDYANIDKVCEVGSKVYIDDGLISLVVQSKGSSIM